MKSYIKILTLSTKEPNACALNHKENGLEQRKKLNLDSADYDDCRYRIVIPNTVHMVSMLYLEGLLLNSVNNLGKESFHDKYEFKGNDDVMDKLYFTVEFMYADKQDNHKCSKEINKKSKSDINKFTITLTLSLLSLFGGVSLFTSILRHDILPSIILTLFTIALICISIINATGKLKEK